MGGGDAYSASGSSSLDGGRLRNSISASDTRFRKSDSGDGDLGAGRPWTLKFEEALVWDPPLDLLLFVLSTNVFNSCNVNKPVAMANRLGFHCRTRLSNWVQSDRL